MASKLFKHHELKSKTFSKKCIDEIKSLTQDIVGWKKLHVAEIGYVYYLKNINGDTVAHVFKDNGKMMLDVKLGV